MEGYDFQPVLDKNGEEDEIKWSINVPGGATQILSYWLKGPDQVGTYEIKTEIYDGQTKLEEVVLNVEVTQTVHSRMIELVGALEVLEVSGKDANLIRQARQFMENILNRSVGSISDHLLNLQDAVQATETLGNVKTKDVSLFRLEAGDIMIHMGRRFYEAVKQTGSSQSIPLAGQMTSN